MQQIVGDIIAEVEKAGLDELDKEHGSSSGVHKTPEEITGSSENTGLDEPSGSHDTIG